MKKHVIAIIILICILSLIGVGIWFMVKRNNVKPLYTASTEFIYSTDTNELILDMTEAQTLYTNKSSSSNIKLNTLKNVITKIDNFEKDLNSYLVLSNAKPSSTNKLSKSYKNVSGARSVLLDNYDEYITRMKGNTNIDGSALEDLYNDIFNETVEYIYTYNDNFESITKYVFNKTYKADNIKSELYLLYSASVNNLLDSIASYQFEISSLSTINCLNNALVLVDSNIQLSANVDGGEFSTQALKFKKYFNSSNISVLAKNFSTYYSESINATTETSYEKLTVYYIKQILEI